MPDELSLLRLLLQGAGIGTWIWNVQTGQVIVNEQWAAIVGYRLDELQPVSIDTWVRLTHPDDLERSGRELERHFRGETARYECEARMRHKDGNWVRVLDRGEVLVRDAQGQPLWMFGSHTDITDKWRAEQSREALLEQFRRLSAHLPGFLYQYRMRPDGSSHFPYATAEIEHVYGWRPEDVADDATPVFRVLHPDDLDRVARGIGESAEQLTPWKDRFRVVHPTRGVIWVEGDAGPEREPDGSTIWHGYLRDVTAEAERDQRLALLGVVFASSQQGIIITDASRRVVEVNDAFTRITGYAREDVVGRRPSILSSGRHGPDFYRRMWREIAQVGRWQGEIWNRRKSGEVFAELLSIDAVRGPGGGVTHYIAIFSDISQIKEHQDELERIAHFDALTGLPNRRLLSDRLEVAIRHARRHGRLVAVCFVDLDDFKEVNDQHGHAAGDRLLVTVAGRLQGALRAEDTVARIGGDEFVLLLTDLPAREEVDEVVGRVLAAARTPVDLGGATVVVSASVGVAIFPDVELSDALLRDADQAMYRAKQLGRDRYVVFDVRAQGAQAERLATLRAIERALAEREFELHFQPVIELAGGRVRSAEALIRWRLPDGRLRPPGEFIDALAGDPLEIAVGRWVIDTALAHQRAWAAQGLELPVSVNIAVDHLLDARFLDDLEALLHRHEVGDPSRLTLEILESSRFTEFERIRERLQAVRRLGVRCSLDDFGTGASSLTHMRQLPVDELKIDRSFVLDMLASTEDEGIVRGVIAMAHAFDHVACAEGAESDDHLARLRALGCDRAQGWGIARAMAAAALPAWVERWQSRPPAFLESAAG